jgi:hypothetical protein
MIPRYQRILFWSLCALILLVSAFTIYERQQSQQRVNASNESMPFIRPVDAPTESVILFLAHDAEGTLLSGPRDAALPTEPSLRAAALLDRLVYEYSLPNSTHPLTAASAVEEVFLLPLPPASPTATANPAPGPGTLAVVNLRGTFADGHPVGVLAETLTIQSMVGTLHANFPELAAVRFLVDGQPRETLAGHADLLRLYPAVDPSIQHTQPVEDREP